MIKYLKDLPQILDEVENNHFVNWSPSEKEQALSRLDFTRLDYLSFLCDGDIKKETRRDLCEGYEQVTEAIKKINNPPNNTIKVRFHQPEIDQDFLVTEDENRKADLIAYSIITIAFLLLVFLFKS